jgi:CubicO group peptidase (beta-lactamase class C family)
MIQRLQAGGGVRLIAKPGERPSYSNLAYALLGHELSQLSAEGGGNQTWENWTESNVIGPLGLKSTGFELPAGTPGAATGYDAEGQEVPPYSMGWLAPCGGMRSSTSDLVKLAEGIMTSRLMPESQTASLLAPAFFNAGGRTLFGTPWEMAYHNRTGFTTRRKGGNVPGFSALVAMVPELRLSMSMAWSGSTDEFAASEAAFDAILEPFVSVQKTLQAGPDFPKAPAPYLGTFSLPGSAAAAASIVEVKGQLLISLLGMNMYLVNAPGRGASATLLRTYIPPDLMPCLNYEILAASGQYVDFSEDFQTFKVPGIIPNVAAVFKRIP